MRVVVIGAVVLTGLLITTAIAADPPNAGPGYTGFDASGVCSDRHLTAVDQKECRLQLDQAMSDEERARIRKQFEARGNMPAPERIAPEPGPSKQPDAVPPTPAETEARGDGL